MSSSIAAGVAGLMTTLARLPNTLMRCRVRCRLFLPSQWTRNASEPASVNSSRNKSGSVIIRWISNGKRVTRRSDSMIGVPIEMFGTKCPSMTSIWMRSAPACSASPTCLPRWAKSAARMEGASFTTCLSISPVPLDHHARIVRVVCPRIRCRSDALLIACLGVGRLKDTLDVGIQPGVELRIGLLGRQSLDQRPRKARHDAVIPAQAVVGFVPCIPARQRHHPYNIGMTDARGIEVVLLRERELEHDQLLTWQVIKLLEEGRFEHLFGLGLIRAVNINFRLDDRHEARGDDLPSDVELLAYNVLDASGIGVLDD